MEKCCFCGKEISVGINGNNASPIKVEGVEHPICCNECNCRIVVPTRLALSKEKDMQMVALDCQCVSLTNENIILGLAFSKACETIISQYIDDEPYMDVIEEWKDESMIEEPGVSNEMLEQYFFEQAQKEVNKDAED